MIAVPAKDPAAPPTEPGFMPARPPRFWRLKRFLRSLNPGPLFFGPVFQRDMRMSGRRKGAYAARFVVLIIPTAIVALVFAESGNQYRYGAYGSAAARIQSLQTMAFAVAATVAWCQLILLSLVAPLLTAGSIVEERTARALSVIAASPLSPGRVVGGLFAARLVQLTLLALLPFPLILAIRTFGGLETSFVLWSGAIAVCSAISMAAVGLFASTRASRPAGAVSTAILFMVLYWAMPPLVVLCDAALHNWSQPTTFVTFVASPPAAMAMVTNPDLAAITGLRADQAAAANCFISLLLAAAALVGARFQLARLIATDRVELVRQPTRRQRRKALRTAAANPEATEENPAAAVPPTAPGPLGPHHEHASREITGNPVAWRELRQPLFAAAWKRWLGVTGIVVVVLIIHVTFYFSAGHISRNDTEPLTIVPAVGALALLLLSAVAVPAGAVTTELEARTWATLLTTPLTPYQILMPKVAGAARRLWPAFLFVTLHLTICIVAWGAPVWTLPFTLIHFAAYAAFLCCTGVFFSLCCRKSAVAATLNIGLAFMLWVLAPLFAGIFLVQTLPGRSGSDALGYFLFTNPLFTYGSGLVGMMSSQSHYNMGPELELEPVPYYAYWALSIAAYLAAARLVLMYANRDFHRLSTARI